MGLAFLITASAFYFLVVLHVVLDQETHSREALDAFNLNEKMWGEAFEGCDEDDPDDLATFYFYGHVPPN